MEKILSDFMEMVTVDAISYDERKVADICLKKLHELGCTDIYEDNAGEKVGGNTGNIFARFPGTLPGSILFSAHMDRMPQGFGIEPVIENGVVSTKGDTILAADDLGGIAAIFDGIRKLGYDPKDIKLVLISHGHFDHVGAAKAVIEYTGAKLYASKEDLAAIEGRDFTALRNRGEAYSGVTPDEFFADDKPITLGHITIKTMLTSGHTPGTTSFFFEDRGADGKVYKLALHGGLGLNTLTANSPDDVPRVKAARQKFTNFFISM